MTLTAERALLIPILDAAEHGLAVVLAHRGEAIGSGGFGDGVECAAEERVEIW